MTLAVGQVKDNAPGLRFMLGDGVSSGIAAEISEFRKNGAIGIDVYIDGEEWVLVQHCKPVGYVSRVDQQGSPYPASVAESPIPAELQATSFFSLGRVHDEIPPDASEEETSQQTTAPPGAQPSKPAPDPDDVDQRVSDDDELSDDGNGPDGDKVH
eukprot:283118-Pleurochrysis_carterae.AAC.1